MKIMINYNKNYTIALFCLPLLLFFASCTPTLKLQEQTIQAPGQFQISQSDTSSTAAKSWALVFSDPYLKMLIDTALLNNQELNILTQEIQMEQNEVLARKGEYLPFVNLATGAGADKVGVYTRDGAVEENLDIAEDQPFPEVLGDFVLGANVSWEVDIWHKLRNAKKSAFLNYLATAEGRNLATTHLVAEIANAYYELLALDNQLNNVEQNISNLNDALEIVRAQKAAGKTTELGVRRFEAEVLKNKSTKYVILQQITETENSINFLVGRFPQPIQRDNSTFIDLQFETLSAGVPAQLLQNRPDIRKAELELEAAKINIEVARAEFYPSLDINAGLGYQAFKPKYLLNTPASLLFSLAGDVVAPVVNRNAIKAQFNTAGARQTQAVYVYEQTLLKAYAEVANQLAKLENLQQSFALKAQQVEALTESVEISNDLFKSARADYFEVLQTQREVLEAKMELIEIKAAQLNASVRMYQALGGGWR
jgi:NodT family efflux transporter outer membrane factor (OMF) lipoprotein